MATTTTNYGFDVPTSSDLVKNGATAISTLGQDIDTFLFRPFTRNAVLNSSFNVWQRGTSIVNSGTSFYAADRWCFNTNATGRTISRQATNDTTNLPFIQYCMRVARDSGNANTASLQFGQSMETINSIPFAGKQVTMSFYARAGANYSAASNALTVYLIGGTGTDQNSFVSYTGSTYPINNQTATLTTTWQRFTFTGTVGATVTELTPYFAFAPTGTAGANDYLEITGVQLEVGNQASPYTPATPTYATELAACQRYFYRTVADGAYTQFGNGHAKQTNSAQIMIPFPVPMRVAPHTLTYSSIVLFDGTTIAGVSAIAVQYNGRGLGAVDVTPSGSFTQYRPYFMLSDNTTSGFIAFSAEL